MDNNQIKPDHSLFDKKYYIARHFGSGMQTWQDG